ncbi:MAG TPA: hypothetical protein VF530_14180 [Planctomycetota bacterium]
MPTLLLALPLLLQAPEPERLSVVLDPAASVTLEAAWAPCRRSKYGLFARTEVLRTPAPAEARRTYPAAELAPFLPPGPVALGEVWPVPREAILPFLRQLHASARAELEYGEPGTFACLRAVGPRRIELLFRAHAEFWLTPEVLYRPAQFEGRLLLDRERGTPLSLSIVLPDRDTNVDVNVRPKGGAGGAADIGHVPELALVSPAPPGLAPPWEHELTDADARRRLARAFYPLARLEWLPFEEALTRASASERSVLVIVLFGTLDDESC